jgi:hypothetical protein
MGAAIVWITLERQNRSWRYELDRLADRLRSKVGLD